MIPYCQWNTSFPFIFIIIYSINWFIVKSYQAWPLSYRKTWLFLVVFISFYIFHKLLELHSRLFEKNIFVTNFPFLANSLTLPPTHTPLTLLMSKISKAWQTFFVNARLKFCNFFFVSFVVSLLTHEESMEFNSWSNETFL